jgi:hypothetical protein
VILLLTAALFLAVLAWAAAPAAAHEHEMIGDYELTVGWLDEPAVVGSVNGLDLGIRHHLADNTTEPVLGVEATLTATLSTGGASVPKALEPQFGRPGSYSFDVIPTREGSYSVRFAGTVNGTAVNATVELDGPLSRLDLEFPVADPTPSDLQAAMAANATAQQATIDKLQSDQAAVQAQASAAMMVGAVGLLAGVAGVGVGALAMRRGRPKP